MVTALKTISVGSALAAGVLISIFGVFVSVFSDGAVTERLLTISIILLFYLVLGLIWGYWQPRFWGWWGTFLGLPGALVLTLYMFKEFKLLYIIYALLIISMACFGSYAGSRASRFPN